jgi:hypothetical protein
MEDLLQQTIDSAAATVGGDPVLAASANGMVFLLIAALGVVMALVYVPIRLFLTLTARSRRLRLLQRIRRLREELAPSLDQGESNAGEARVEAVSGQE